MTADLEIEAERERAASIADGLAERWEASAARLRQRGVSRFFWIGPRYVTPQADKDAKGIEAAAHGLRTVARLIREGVEIDHDSAKLEG
jgi:hypothetical protein